MGLTLPGGGKQKNYVFLGEAGCGKSEIAVNLAAALAAEDSRVHLFDLDMSKPLFRSRDLEDTLAQNGVQLHYQEQFMDAPTRVGGVDTLLRSPEDRVILDVGGDYIGARAVGAYAPLLNREDTAVYYVINPFRPWSDSLEHIDMVLSQVLGVSHIAFDRLHFIANPNLGPDTGKEDFLSGCSLLENFFAEGLSIDFYCAEAALCKELEDCFDKPLLPLQLYLTYPWYIRPGDAAGRA